MLGWPMIEGAGIPRLYGQSGKARPYNYADSTDVRWEETLSRAANHTNGHGDFNRLPPTWPRLYGSSDNIIAWPLDDDEVFWTSGGGEAASLFFAYVIDNDGGGLSDWNGIEFGGRDNANDNPLVISQAGDDSWNWPPAGDPDNYDHGGGWHTISVVRPEGATPTARWNVDNGTVKTTSTGAAWEVAASPPEITTRIGGNLGTSVGMTLLYLFRGEVAEEKLEMLHLDPWGPFRSWRRISKATGPTLVNLSGAQPAPSGGLSVNHDRPDYTLLQAINSTTNQSTYSTTSISPSADKLILATILSEDSAEPVINSVSGNGLTWVLVDSSYYVTSGTHKKVSVYRAMGSSPSTGALSVTFSAAQDGCRIVVEEFGDVDTGGTNGSAAVVQSANFEDASNTSGEGISVTLAAFGAVENGTFFVIADDSLTTLFDPDDPQAARKTNGNIDVAAMATFWQPENDTTPSATQDDGTVAAGMIALEIKYSAGGTNIALAGAQPAATGAISDMQAFIGVSGTQPAPSGSIAAQQTLAVGPLAGAQPASSGGLGVSGFISLAGAQPAPSGTISAQTVTLVALAGAQPAATGSISAQSVIGISLTGAQPAPSGSISAQVTSLIALAGAQPAATGALSLSGFITLAGAQPAATGALTFQQTLAIALAGDQAAASGSLAALQTLLVNLAGVQAAPTGTVLGSALGTDPFKLLTLGERSFVITLGERSFLLTLGER